MYIETSIEIYHILTLQKFKQTYSSDKINYSPQIFHLEDSNSRSNELDKID